MLQFSDEIIIQQGLIKGKEDAFKKVFIAYHAKVCRLALKFVKSEELVKEVIEITPAPGRLPCCW